MLLFVHDLLISLLNKLEHFFGLVLVRIVDIGIGMVFTAELTIGFFDFIIRGIPGDAQHFIWI